MVLHELWKKCCPFCYTVYSAKDSPYGDILNRVRKSCVRMDKPNTDTRTCAYRRTKKNENTIWSHTSPQHIVNTYWSVLNYGHTPAQTSASWYRCNHTTLQIVLIAIKCSAELIFHQIPLQHQEECLQLQGHPQPTVDILCLGMCCAWSYEQTLGNAAALCSLVYIA